MKTLAAFVLATAFLGGSSLGQEEPSRIPDPVVENATDAPTFLGLYFWKQAIWQYTADAEGEFSVEKGDVWGGRLVGGMGFGRFGVEMRADVSGLKEQFSFEDPETFNTLEVFGAIHYVALTNEGMQIGPAVVLGSVIDEGNPGGIGLNVYGGGIRLGGHGAEFHILYAAHDYLPTGGWRFSFSGHIPIYGKVYAVGDLVAGKDGYARVGVAFRLK